MYEEFYGFSEKPFKIIPNPDYLYLSPKHKNALTVLRYGFEENVGFILLTGEIGSGKTTIINYILKRIESDLEVAVLFNTNINADELLSMILRGFELEPDETSKANSLETLFQFLIDQYAENKRCLLIIDEAQNLSKEALEEVRMLSNLQGDDQMLLQIMLVGQPELKIRLKDPGFSQFAQRIAVNYHLESLTHSETAEYIKHRLKKTGGDLTIFSAEAIEAIFRSSGGIPRTINLLCDSALVYGFADEVQSIDVGIIENVIRELGFIKDLGFVGVYSPPAKVLSAGSPEASAKNSNWIEPRLQDIEEGIRDIEAHLERQPGMIKRKLDGFKEELVEELKNFFLRVQKLNNLRQAQDTGTRMNNDAANNASERKKKPAAAPDGRAGSKRTVKAAKSARRGHSFIRDILEK